MTPATNPARTSATARARIEGPPRFPTDYRRNATRAAELRFDGVESAGVESALELWRRGTERLLAGAVGEAVALFSRSLETYPTAEAYTFRGWAYSFEGRLGEAIEECRKAIATDPTFGNPYNDIGCYLMEQGKLDDAAPWFEKAKRASRYEPRHFPYLNLGRLRALRGEFADALVEFQGALERNPGDPIALRYLEALRFKVN